MNLAITNRASAQYAALPRAIQKKFDKQIAFLLANLRHPSLKAKKYDESKNVWQARVDRNYRFYFLIEGDTYYVLAVIAHPQ